MRESTRAARDRAVLDHLTKGPIKPAKHSGKGTRFGEKEAEAVERAIQERWSSRTGRGLPEF